MDKVCKCVCRGKMWKDNMGIYDTVLPGAARGEVSIDESLQRYAVWLLS